MACIVTYGGGEILYNVFNAISMLVGGKNGSLFYPLVTIGASFGFMWIVASAFYESAMEGIPRRWLIPVLVIYSLFLVPTVRVHIKDPILRSSGHADVLAESHVDHVPFGLALFAQTISAIGATLTQGVEKCFRLPDDVLYNKTGHIFGAENLFEANRYVITDPILAQNMYQFVTQCIAFDMALGRYSIDELKKSLDIWGLVKEKTSRVRSFKYCSKDQPRCCLKTCREGAALMDRLLMDEKGKFNKNEIFKNLPFAFEALTQKSAATQDMITQQIMIHSIMDGLDKKAVSFGLESSYAGSRAAIQQRQTYKIAGELAGKSIVVLRNIIEALVYASFIFIIPLLLLPMGFRIFLTWMGLNLWIQLWPPFYAILNFIMTICMQMQTKRLLSGFCEADMGLSIYTSTGLMSIAQDMQAIAGYIALSIPFISYAIIKGGVSSFVHLSASLMGPAQGAAGTAVQEEITGNYAYGNVQMDNQGYSAQHMLTRQSAPHISSGYYRESTGGSDMVVGGEKIFFDEKVSSLTTDIQGSQSMSGAMRRQSQEMVNQGESQRSMASQAFASSMRELSDLTRHISQSEAYDQVMSQNQSVSMSKMASDTLRKAEQWGKKYGFDVAQSTQILGSASLSAGGKFFIGGALGSQLQGTSEAKKNEIMDCARLFVQDEGLSQNFQALLSMAKDKRVAIHDDQGQRLSESASTLYDASQSYQTQADRYHQKSASYSALADYADSHSLSVNHKLNQEFVDYVVEKTGGPKKALYVMHNRPEEFETLKSNFIRKQEQRMMAQVNHYDVGTQEGYDQAKSILEKGYIPLENPIQRPQKTIIQQDSTLDKKKNALDDQWNTVQSHVGKKINAQEKIEKEKEALAQSIEDSQSTSKFKQAIKNVWK